MSRASRADASKHREEVVTAASRLLRERGSAAVSIQDVMSAAGLTHGGFYKHFRSKEELAGIATVAAFEELHAIITRTIEEQADGPAARAAFLEGYLTTEHRDAPGAGCPNTGLAGDAARAPADSALREHYTAGVKRTLELFAHFESAPDQDEAEAYRKAIFDLATLVGALTLARATAGDAVSDEILSVVRTTLDADG